MVPGSTLLSQCPVSLYPVTVLPKTGMACGSGTSPGLGFLHVPPDTHALFVLLKTYFSACDITSPGILYLISPLSFSQGKLPFILQNLCPSGQSLFTPQKALETP